MSRWLPADSRNNGAKNALDPGSFRATDPGSRQLLAEARFCLDDVRADLEDVARQLARLKASIAVPAEFLRAGLTAVLRDNA
jgi:hypothetical protein